ncbi:MAG: hypothetical protein IT271_12565 [Chitinophagales bacterium]|nr:hypothetical protein [Chitinophagales bacterium]
MHFLDSIISYINTEIKKVLTDPVYQKAEFRGIAETVYEATNNENEFLQLPCVIDEKGALKVVPDDKYSLLIYYRVPSELSVFENGYGDQKKQVKDTVEVSMMVYGFRNLTGKNSREVNADLKDAIPFNVTIKEQGTGNVLLKVEVMPGSTNYQTKQLLEREFGTPHYSGFLRPENYFFEIKIKIEGTHERGCLTCKC